MTNFLQLCQRASREANIPGTGPTTVTGQTGELGQMVSWVATAYEDIQNFHSNWAFLQESFSFLTEADKAEYTPLEAGITDLNEWYTSDFRIYEAVPDEYYLVYEPWAIYRPSYQYGTLRTQTSKSRVITVKPNKNLFLWPIPNGIYTVNGQYFMQPDIMTDDSDIPIFPSNFHLAIVWRALMFYGANLAANEAYSHGRAEYKKIMRKMEVNRIEKMRYGAPLA
jgi:hypothetical protein